MSIKLKQAAQDLLQALTLCRIDARLMHADDAQRLLQAGQALRTAIQQAESEPVGEPRARVELMKTGGNVGLSTRIIELDIATRERLRPGDLLYTHPAPSVPDDVVRDAISTVREHYRGTDWGKAAESICDAIDAMLAASKAQKGGA